MNERCEGCSVPSGSFQSSATKFFAHAYHLDWSLIAKFQTSQPDGVPNELCRNPLAPLLKMKRDVEGLTLIQKTCCPIWVHRSRSRSALATSNDPINRVKASSSEPLT